MNMMLEKVYASIRNVSYLKDIRTILFLDFLNIFVLGFLKIALDIAYGLYII